MPGARDRPALGQGAVAAAARDRPRRDDVGRLGCGAGGGRRRLDLSCPLDADWHVVLFRWADGRVAVSAGVPAKPLDECVCP
jgi:hypothetical protein